MARPRSRGSGGAGSVKAGSVDVQLYGGGDQKRNQRARKRRLDRIKRFRDTQRQKQNWINFADIADWCAREGHSILPDKKRRDAAFETLANDLLAGEFEENGRSCVLYLHPFTARARMTREWLKDAIEHDYDRDDGRTSYLPHCWIPRHLFDSWLIRHRLERSPPLFQPQESRQPDGTRAPTETASPRPPLAPRKKSSPARERAQRALAELYPDRVPNAADVPNKVLYGRVTAHLEKAKPPLKVSLDTVLRAAGRRRK
jgi:hypothetical protein